MKHVQASLSAWQVTQCSHNHHSQTVKLVQACFHARKDRESNFHHCGGPVKLVQAR